MAKRFTDSDKWKDAWFSELKQEDKLLWLYLLDECNHAGIWKVNMRFLNFAIGSSYTLDSLIKVLGSRIYLISNEYLLIEKWVHYQHPNGLNQKSKPQKAAIDMLLKFNVLDRVIKGYNNPIITLQDKDKDKDIDIDIDNDNDGAIDEVNPESKTKTFVPPSLEEFIAYAQEILPKLNPDWKSDQIERCATNKFETYEDDNWHDGFGKQIKVWKTKARNSLKHEMPYKYGKAENQSKFGSL